MHQDGPDAASRAVAQALKPSARSLVEENDDIYESNDFKVGINTSKLVEHRDLLGRLIEIDRRGGIFRSRR